MNRELELYFTGEGVMVTKIQSLIISCLHISKILYIPKDGNIVANKIVRFVVPLECGCFF